MEHKPDQAEQRSLAATLAAAAVTGTAAGTANALAHQAIDKITSKPKPKKDSRALTAAGRRGRGS